MLGGRPVSRSQAVPASVPRCSLVGALHHSEQHYLHEDGQQCRIKRRTGHAVAGCGCGARRRGGPDCVPCAPTPRHLAVRRVLLLLLLLLLLHHQAAACRGRALVRACHQS